MSGFELFFSLFGLILGLAIAVVVGGMSDALRERTRVRTGVLTPMLALVVLFDIATLWVNSWDGLRDMPVAYGPYLSAMVVAAVYFFAASMVFPKMQTDWPSLDEYYLRHYRFVIGGIMTANLGLGTIIMIADRKTILSQLDVTLHRPTSIVFWGMLILLMLIPKRSVQLIGLGVLIAMFLYGIVAYWGPR